MSEDHPSLGYLDALFASLRAYTQQLEASRTWLTRAQQTESLVWRLSFLRASRAAFERAPRYLAEIVEQLRSFGAAEDVPPPLDRIQRNLRSMRADLEAHGQRISVLETEIARASKPVGLG